MAEPNPIGRTDASTERMTPLGAPDGDPLVGTGYRALALIGGGAHSEVFRAEHVKLGTVAAVKIMREAIGDAPRVAERMRLEAQALARLSHVNLVQVVDFGICRGRPLIAMEHLIGRPLKEELAARRTLPVAEAIDVACQALAGLQVAHEAGLVHRDIHPGNLFLCAPEPGATAERRTVKVLNFGLLRLLPGDGALELSRASVPTADGTTVGDQRYGAPEQATGRPADATADVYAVAAVLYRMLAGREPYAHHPSLAGVLRAKLTEVPQPPSRFATQLLPHALDRLVLQALAKAPDERPPSARSFAESLARIAASAGIGAASVAEASSPPETSPSHTPRREPGPWLSTIAMDRDGAESPQAQGRDASSSRLDSGTASGERLIAAEAPTPAQGIGEGLLKPGDSCGPYRIVHEVGRGAMGIVYLAHTARGEQRAIKVLQLTARIRSDLAERFKREIQLLSYVDHVHVVRFYEAGVLQIHGKPTLWVALEYLAGRTLRELRNESTEPIAVDRIVRWGRQIAQGVQEVHKLGVIHRDLKPENISIVQGDVAKVFDFGIAKYRAWGVRATDIHRKLGTLPYMSPEQLDGSVPVDARSDVFALGLILHELATGRHPFIDLREQIDMHEAILRQVTMPAERLDALISGFPADISAIVDRAVSKRPQDRFANMAELADALGECIRRLRSEARAAALDTGIGPVALDPNRAASIPAPELPPNGPLSAPRGPGRAELAAPAPPATVGTAPTRGMPKQTVRMAPLPSVPPTERTATTAPVAPAAGGGVTPRGLLLAVGVAAGLGAAATLAIAWSSSAGGTTRETVAVEEQTAEAATGANPTAPPVPPEAPEIAEEAAVEIASSAPDGGPGASAASAMPVSSANVEASASASASSAPTMPATAAPSPPSRPRPLPFGKPRF